MAFPTSPSNGDKYIKDNADIYTYASATNAWSITGHVGGLGDIYITSNNFNINMGAASGGYDGGTNLYSVNVSNYIYSFSWGYTGGYKLLCLYFTNDSSAFPVRDYVSLPYSISPKYSMLSQYLDSGVIYFNGWYSGSGVHYYDTFNTSTFAWTTANSGSHTTGTLINSALQLNGFQYDSIGLWQSASGTLWADIQTKVTKL